MRLSLRVRLRVRLRRVHKAVVGRLKKSQLSKLLHCRRWPCVACLAHAPSSATRGHCVLKDMKYFEQYIPELGSITIDDYDYGYDYMSFLFIDYNYDYDYSSL